MKKLIISALIAAVAVFGAAAEDIEPPNFADVEDAFGEFADSLAIVAPFASNVGLNWSDPYIGQFPHFGVGVTAGFVGLSVDAFASVFGSLAGEVQGAREYLLGELPEELRPVAEDFGIPLPVVSAEARLGGLLLPFDVGVKVGYTPEELDRASELPEGISVDYKLFGFDVRVPLIREKGLIPELAVGGGFNYLFGSIGMPIGEEVSITAELPDLDNPGSTKPYALTVGAPTVGFQWETSVIDIKAQLSKAILIFRPYIGVGATYGWSEVVGGVTGQFSMDPALSSEDVEQINAILETAGKPTLPQFSDTGFTVASRVDGISPRVFAGLALNLFFIKVDVAALYEIWTESMGLTANVRLQF